MVTLCSVLVNPQVLRSLLGATLEEQTNQSMLRKWQNRMVRKLGAIL